MIGSLPYVIQQGVPHRHLVQRQSRKLPAAPVQDEIKKIWWEPLLSWLAGKRVMRLCTHASFSSAWAEANEEEGVDAVDNIKRLEAGEKEALHLRLFSM